MTSLPKRSIVIAACAVGCCASGLAQVEPPVILRIEYGNGVRYIYDTVEPSALATVPTRLSQTRPTFATLVILADIVAVNDRPAKGVMVVRQVGVNLTTSPSAGQAIADVVRGNAVDRIIEILQPDGTPIGSLMTMGFDAGPPAPGAPASFVAGNNVIIGGTGAFLGARGQLAGGGPPTNRDTSVKEDPAARRTNGGGGGVYFAHVIPMSRPEVVMSPTGPSVFHSDFSVVSSARPARPGEVLIMMAANLGPTRPAVDPGTPFPHESRHEVNSPVDVIVNGRPAEVINKVGWPGLENVYRVDFRVPEGTGAGALTVQLSAAWVAGSPVRVQVQ